MSYKKYRNKKIKVDNISFDSKKEANRYRDLKMLQQAGLIYDLKLQVPFVLQESFKINNKTIREIKYIADFTYYKKKTINGIDVNEYVVEDAKGMKTNIYKLKAKMFAYKYGFEISEV